MKSTHSLNDHGVQKVLNIAKEIMGNNKVIDAKDLYQECIRKLKMPKARALSTIQFLFRRKIIVEGSKLTRDTVLKNSYRKEIFDLITKQKVVHFSFLKKQVFSGGGNDGSPGQLIWHLGVLLKFGMIQKVKLGNFTLFRLPTIPSREGKIRFMLQDHLNKEIILFLGLADHFVKKAAIVQSIDGARSSIYYRLNNLEKNSVIRVKPSAGGDLISINPEIKGILSRILDDVKGIDSNDQEVTP